MKLTPELKEKIDSMTYMAMLMKWRFAPIGDPMFQGESGDYYTEVMYKKKAEVGADGHTAASKAVGWEKP